MAKKNAALKITTKNAGLENHREKNAVLEKWMENEMRKCNF